MDVKAAIARLCALCEEVGFDLSSADPLLLARLEKLERHTETVADAERMVGNAWRLFRLYAEEFPEEAFTELERRTVVLGVIFSDIGKTGPFHADVSQSRLVVEIFSVEGVRDDAQTVSAFFRAYFPEDAEAREARFVSLGLDPAMTIRQFWNLHSEWTLEIAEHAGVPPEIAAAAATHHMLEDVNPEEIVGEDDRFSRQFGENLAFDRAEKLIIVLDKYDALRRRGRRSHEDSIAWICEHIDRSPRFAGDSEFDALLKAAAIAFV